ncbi:hypothetical protein SBRCBS47491_000754 [Sporothrix bragantina]|uniref:Uncharacterized protein n=1 Tax=Sporothrix bragantina TaxID=671064 RepID=A0ABP0ASX5_9PEZI
MLRSLSLLAFVGTALAMAQPSCTTAACVYDDPSATPAITSYPTTLTFSSTWSTVRTITPDDDPAGGTLQTTTEYQTAITYEPHAAAPTSFPATVLQSVTTSHTFVWTSRGSATTTTTDEPTSSQWIVHQPAATDLPRRALGRSSSANSTVSTWKPAQQCLDAEQQTGCVRQCTQRDDLWYCFDKHAWYEENVMGRVCWWQQPDDNGTGNLVTQYLMLAEPCIDGDVHVECEACRLYG